MKILDVPGWIILALLLTLLVANSCAVSSQQLLGSPNFVKENLPRLLSLEKESEQIVAQLRMMTMFGIAPEDSLEEMQEHYNFYWVYYNAANVYLSNGNRDLFVQAIARAEQALQKVRDAFQESLGNLESPEPETKPETLSF